jgi:hypothetical protein
VRIVDGEFLVPLPKFSTYEFVGNPDGELNHSVVVVCHFVVAFTTLCSVVVSPVRTVNEVGWL